jgi:O-antigen ligase
VKSISGVLWSPIGIGWLWRTKLAYVILPILAGLITALLILALGPIMLPVIFSIFFFLPWLMQDVFRLFIWLIVTWPILTLFLRIQLPAGIPDISYDRALVLLLLCIVIVETLLSKRRLKKITPLDILILLYFVAQLSSRLFVLWFEGIGKPNLNGLLDIVLIPLILYWVAKNLIASRTHLKWFLYALVIASLLICLTGLYEQASGRRVFAVSSTLGGWETHYYWQDVGGLRAAGALGNPAIYGATLGMGILAGICSLAHIKRKLIQATFVVTIGVLSYGLFASFTRSAWLSVFIVLFIAQFFVNGLWKRTLPIFVLGLVLLVLIWAKLPSSSTIVSRAMTTRTITPRLEVTQLGWERFLEKPLLGWGSGALDTLGVMQVITSSHNIFLSFLVDGGLFLFLSFLAVVSYLLNRAIRVYEMTAKSSLEGNVLVAMMGNILIFLLSGLALELHYFGYFNALFWISAGVIDRLGQRADG